MISSLNEFGRSPYGIRILFTVTVGGCWAQVWRFDDPPVGHHGLAIVLTEQVRRVVAYREINSMTSVEDVADQVVGRRLDELLRDCIQVRADVTPWFLLELDDEGFLPPGMWEIHAYDNRDR